MYGFIKAKKVGAVLVGDAEAFVLAVHTAMETGMDRLMVLRQRSDEGMLRRHELRLRELERDLAQVV